MKQLPGPGASADRRTAFREAVLLPAVLLSVALAGGFRAGSPASPSRFVPPPLVTLILAVLLVGVLVRGHLFAPERLMGAVRTPLENISGLMVIVSLFAASAQVLHALTPDAGLLHLFVNLLFFAVLAAMLVANASGPPLLRGLAVALGVGLLTRHVLLAALYDPSAGLGRRLVTALLEGATLGGLDYQADPPLSGYIAFFAVLAYLVGVWLLPRRPI
jgi:hypothetical protein